MMLIIDRVATINLSLQLYLVISALLRVSRRVLGLIYGTGLKGTLVIGRLLERLLGLMGL
jgi:hypothetical protein